MKALTVLQPWASAIVECGKDVENRSTLWKHRGSLAIHAGAGWSMTGQRSYLVRHAMRRIHSDDPWWRDLPKAAIIGRVNLVDAHRTEPGCCTSSWAEPESPVHLVLEEPLVLDVPIPCRGRLGLWTPDDWIVDVLELVQ